MSSISSVHKVLARVLEVDTDAAWLYAELIVDLRRAGTPLPTNDVWIVALALRVRIPGQVGQRFQSKLATDSGMKLATCSDVMLATFGSCPESVANISPE